MTRLARATTMSNSKRWPSGSARRASKCRSIVVKFSAVAAGAASFALPSIVQAKAASAHVVVVGGGFGGATAARYLRQFAPHIQVTLVEPAERFYTCPFSNLYLAGLRSWDSIGHGYGGLRKAGVNVVHARADRVLTDSRRVLLSNGQALSYDKLVLSPGIDMRWNALEGYDEAAAQLAPMPGRPERRPSC